MVETYRDAREAELVKMEGADEFLAGCLQWGIQLILFGHQHYPYQRSVVAKGSRSSIDTPFGCRIAAIRTFCCPTTLQYDAKGNGFYLFDFSSKSRVEWTSIGSLRTEGERSRPMKQLEHRAIELDAELTSDEKVAAYEVALG